MSRTVVLADDHQSTRLGVRAALEGGGFTVRGEARTAEEAVEQTVLHRPDVAVLDVVMPGDGIVAAGRIAAEAPDTAVVMLTASRSDEHLFAALQAGAVGYLLKDTDPTRLPMALQGVLDGEAALPRTLVARLIREYQGSRRRRMLGGRPRVELTPREWEVLDLLAEDLSTKEIAERLEVSPVTVRRHVSGLFDKLDVTTRAEAVGRLSGTA